MLRNFVAIACLGMLFSLGCGGKAKTPTAGTSTASSTAGSTAGPTVSVTAPAMAPKAGEGSTVLPVPLPPVDAASWKVKAEAVAPPAGLKSHFPLDVKLMLGAAFPSPSVGQAAVIEQVHREKDTAQVLDWIQIDLTKDGPPLRVHLWRDDTPREELPLMGSGQLIKTYALSPSGERLAWIGGHTLFVWSKDGTVLLRKPFKGVNKPIEWASFISDDRLALWIDGNVKQIAIPSGEVGPTLPVAGLRSPGGTWLAGYGTQEIAFYAAADHGKVGAIPIPAGYTAAGFMFHPSGKQFTISMRNASADVIIGIWDLDSGQPVKSAAMTYAGAQRQLAGGLVWAGPDTLLCNSTFFHMGLKDMIGNNRWGNEERLAGPSPDARFWSIHSLREPKQTEQLAAKLGPDAKTDTIFLAAATVPPPELEAQWIAAAATSVKAVVEGVPEKFKNEIAAGLAEALAKQGLRSDPEAKVKIELKIIQEGDGQTTGKDIPQDQLTTAMKEYLKTNPHDKWVQLVTMKNLRIDGTIYDETGKQAAKIQTYLFSRPVDDAGNSDPLWQALAKWEGVMTLPRPLLPGAGGKKSPLPEYITPGIDGLVDPVVQ